MNVNRLILAPRRSLRPSLMTALLLAASAPAAWAVSSDTIVTTVTPTTTSTTATVLATKNDTLGAAGSFHVNSTGSGANALESYHSGSGIAIFGSNTGTGIGVEGCSFSGMAGYFKITSASVSPALKGETNGSGAAVFGYTNGTGYAGLFQIDNPTSAAGALEATSTGTGHAGVFLLTNPMNGLAAIEGETYGTSASIGVLGYNFGLGNSALFYSTRTDNTSDVVFAETSCSTGYAGRFTGGLEVGPKSRFLTGFTEIRTTKHSMRLRIVRLRAFSRHEFTVA